MAGALTACGGGGGSSSGDDSDNAPTYTIGGNVTGLLGAISLLLNNDESLGLNADGTLHEPVISIYESSDTAVFTVDASGTIEATGPGEATLTARRDTLSGETTVRVRQVAGLSDDLALGLGRTVRIIAPIPGKTRIGFELPNDSRVPVNLRELVEDEDREEPPLELTHECETEDEWRSYEPNAHLIAKISPALGVTGIRRPDD